MTQPVQEPTLQRTDARLTWGSNQLFRRPAPPSDEPEIKYMVGKSTTSGVQVFTADDTSDVLWQHNVNPYPECFEPLDAEFSPDYNKIRILEDGLFTVSCHLALTSSFDHDWALTLYSVDPTTGVRFHRSLWGKYDYDQGFPDAILEWTFRMAGGSGTSNEFEFQFYNANPAEDIETQFTGGTYIEIRKWPGTITMTGRDRDTDPG